MGNALTKFFEEYGHKLGFLVVLFLLYRLFTLPLNLFIASLIPTTLFEVTIYLLAGFCLFLLIIKIKTYLIRKKEKSKR